MVVFGRVLFALPFVAVGVMSVYAGLGGLPSEGHPAFLVVFGLVFAGAGGWQVFQAVRASRSEESRRPLVEAGEVSLAPLRPVHYRTSGLALRTAAEIYGPLLASLPVSQFTPRPGRKLPMEISLADRGAPRETVVFTAIWCAAVVPLFVLAALSGSAGATLFMLPFVAVAVYFASKVARRWLGRRKLARVEIDQEPVYLGNDIEIYVEQRGPALLLNFEVRLECEEAVTYVEGTNTRSEQTLVHSETLSQDITVRLGSGDVLVKELRATLPLSPHSFKSEHNQISWRVVVNAVIDGWPDYEEGFEFRALPRVSQ
jgi:hypothetical protein